MDLTGEQLYQMYVEALSLEGVGADEWTDLDQYDHAAWDFMATQLQKKAT
jgi:hypothetical protein